MLIDGYKVSHWMNRRKLTVGQVATSGDVSPELLDALLGQSCTRLPDQFGSRLCDVLRVDVSQIIQRSDVGAGAIVMSADAVRASRRGIQRDGIHFYNYYSMAGPPGRVAPVILDILCPHDRTPKLNNGHLEPAITVNLGPGDIHGRWGEELEPATWSVLRANRGGEDDWIVGDSYVEPSYCRHSYSLASKTPARIVSYTAESNIAALLEESNGWSNEAFDAFLEDVDDAEPARLLSSALTARAFDARSASSASDVAEERIAAFLSGRTDAMSIADLARLGAALGFDYRTLLEPARRHDSVGKTCCSIDSSRATIRAFAGYTVASMACAPHLPDLVGQFMRVERPAEVTDRLDLCVGSESHFLVTAGEPTLTWRDTEGRRSSAVLTEDASAWVAPYVTHGWSGEGAVLRFGSGRCAGYLDAIEMSNTFAPGATLRRGRRDVDGWGYEPAGTAG